MRLTDDKTRDDGTTFLHHQSSSVESSDVVNKETPKHKEWKMETLRVKRDEGAEKRTHFVCQQKEKVPAGALKNSEKDNGKAGNRENDLNMNKKEEKIVRQLTEELDKLKFEPDADRKKKNDSADTRCTMKGGDGCLVNGIIADLKCLKLESETDDKTKTQLTVKIEPVDEDSSSRDFKQWIPKSEVGKHEDNTIEVFAHPVRKGEENEDFEATHLLSSGSEHGDSCKSGCCMSFVGRGPDFGRPTDSYVQNLNLLMSPETRDYPPEFYPPRKFMKPVCPPGPGNFSAHMCGGCVEEVQPHVQPSLVVDPRILGSFHGSVSQHQNQELQHPPWLNGLSCIPNSYYNNGKSNQNGWIPTSQPMYFDESICPNEFMNVLSQDLLMGEDIFPGFDVNTAPFSFQSQMQSAQNGQNAPYTFTGKPSSGNSYCSSVYSANSPGDQQVASPGSSPPSYINSPASMLSSDPEATELTPFSPSSLSIASPESGFADFSEASHDLETESRYRDALEYIKEEMEAMEASRHAPPIPERVKEFDCDPIKDVGGMTYVPTSLPTSFSMGIHKGEPSASKKKTKKTPTKAQQGQGSRILPEVTLPVTIFPPTSVIGGNSLQATVQIPCFVVSSSQRPLQPSKPRPIRPKAETNPPAATVQAQQTSSPLSALPKFSPPAAIPEVSQEQTAMSPMEDLLVKAYRWVAGLTKEKLLTQDEDGDTMLHLTIVKEETKLVKALLERYVREGLIDNIVNMANKQHQTPLCLAVFLNQTDIVKMLIDRNAEVNVQLQRKLNGGLIYYRLIHFTAKRGKKWVPTLIQLLTAENIDLHAYDSDGCTAMHCAIRAHGQGAEKVDSKDTIYHLAQHGADLNIQDGLSGKTPLHYVIETKDSALVGWFLGLASFIESSGVKQPASANSPQGLVYSLLNAKTNSGITALQLALNLQMDRSEHVKILEMLLRYGAEVPQKSCDGKLRQELAKFPELALLLKNGTSAAKAVR